MLTTIVTDDKCSKVIMRELRRLLTGEYNLYSKTCNADWRIDKDEFCAVHNLFESQYEQLDYMIDGIADQIRNVNQNSPSSLKIFLELDEATGEKSAMFDAQTAIEELLISHENMIGLINGDMEAFKNELFEMGLWHFLADLAGQHNAMYNHLRTFSC